MSIGMNLPVTGPRPAARLWATAVSAFPRLEGGPWEPDGKGVKRWLNGVSFSPYGCGKIVGTVFDPCVQRDTEAGRLGDIVSFDPFLAEVAVECPVREHDYDQMVAYVRAHMEVAISSVIGAQVMMGVANPAALTLASEAQVVDNPDVSLIGALAGLEDALADLLDGGAGMIHVPAGMLSALQTQGGLVFIDGQFYTATGHLVVADAGYLGPSPVTGAPVAGEVWMYGSGPVMLKLDDAVHLVGSPWEEINYTTNTISVDAEQYALVMFEPCSVVASKIDLSEGSLFTPPAPDND